MNSNPFQFSYVHKNQIQPELQKDYIKVRKEPSLKHFHKLEDQIQASESKDLNTLQLQQKRKRDKQNSDYNEQLMKRHQNIEIEQNIVNYEVVTQNDILVVNTQQKTKNRKKSQKKDKINQPESFNYQKNQPLNQFQSSKQKVSDKGNFTSFTKQNKTSPDKETEIKQQNSFLQSDYKINLENSELNQGGKYQNISFQKQENKLNYNMQESNSDLNNKNLQEKQQIIGQIANTFPLNSIPSQQEKAKDTAQSINFKEPTKIKNLQVAQSPLQQSENQNKQQKIKKNSPSLNYE